MKAATFQWPEVVLQPRQLNKGLMHCLWIPEALEKAIMSDFYQQIANRLSQGVQGH